MSAPTGFKRLGVAVGALVGAGLFLLVAVSYLVSADAARDAVMAEIKAATGFQPTVRGPVSLSLFPSPQVSLSNVTLENPDTRDSPLMAERILAHVRWLPLLTGRFEIADVALDHPRIALTIGRDGHSNWSPLIDMLARTVRTGGEVGAPTLSFSEIRISNGVIVVEDRVRSRTETLERVELSFAWPSITKRFVATGRVSWRDEPLDIGLTIADFPAALAGDVSGLKLRIAGAPVKLAFDGAMSYLPSVKIDGTLAADTTSLRNAMRWVSGESWPGSGLGRLSLNARTNVVGGAIALSNHNIELDGNVAEGVLTYATRGRRILQGTLAVDTLDLTPYASALRLLTAGSRAWDRKPIALDWFDAVDLDLRVSAARVIAGHSQLGRSAAAATLRNGQLTVTVGESQGFNGVINGSVAITKTNEGAQLRSQLRLTNVDLETSLADIFGFRRLEGKGDLSLELDAEGRNVLALARTLNGSVTLAATKGALTGFNIEQLLRRLERRPLAGSADFRSGRTPFETLKIALRVTQGLANLEEGHFVSANVRLALSGRASVPARELDISGTASLLKEGAAPPTFELPFFVQGSWDDPIMLPDTQALIRRSGAAAPLLDAVIDQRAREGVRSAIDRLMGDTTPAPRNDAAIPIPTEPPSGRDVSAEGSLSR
ncbi:MAG: AsmA family protein [Xanthobacteraceae bacterium]